MLLGTLSRSGANLPHARRLLWSGEAYAGGTVRTMILHHLFPALLVAFNIGAAVTSFMEKDWMKGAYWLLSAACLALVHMMDTSASQ